MQRQVLVIFLFCLILCCRHALAQEDNSACSPIYFDSILVEEGEIVVTDQYENGRVNKFVLKRHGRKKMYKYDEEGKQIDIREGRHLIVYAGKSEQIGEQLQLVKWKGSEAHFKLIRTCIEPACVPRETKECEMKVRFYWKNEKK